MDSSSQSLQPFDTEITQEQWGFLCCLCYYNNRLAMSRWFFTSQAWLEDQLSNGWSYELIYKKGLLKYHLETKYGLTDQESTSAIDLFPLTEQVFWEDMTKENIPDRALYVFKKYMKTLTGELTETSYNEGKVPLQIQPTSPEFGISIEMPFS